VNHRLTILKQGDTVAPSLYEDSDEPEWRVRVTPRAASAYLVDLLHGRSGRWVIVTATMFPDYPTRPGLLEWMEGQRGRKPPE
jgi:hypothetical protein